jgi:hypothetical protein
MLEGKCPKCGTDYHGWALLNPRHQSCPRCGVGLEITEGSHRVSGGYSPFGAERYFVIRPDNMPLSQDEDSSSQVKNQ